MSFVLKPGLTGPNIEKLQRHLIANGALPDTDSNGNANLDGRFGQITRNAVIEHQKNKGLAPDGFVNQATAQSLEMNLPEPDLGHRVAVGQAPADHILTQQQLRKLAEKVDALIPTGPFDFFDDAAIHWLVRKLDSALAHTLPPNIVEFLAGFSVGLEGNDMAAFKKRLTDAINKQVNVPLLSEEIEGSIINFFVGLVVDGLRLGSTFDDALNKPVPQPV
ncbi:MAG: peptidoglycan-binding domain-containing protein [Gallionellaceae bacterium]|nr:peptidoglycan-binding domain-containing protein [Gallionellaceae bacterium]